MIIIALTKNLHLPAPDALRAPEPAVGIMMGFRWFSMIGFAVSDLEIYVVPLWIRGFDTPRNLLNKLPIQVLSKTSVSATFMGEQSTLIYAYLTYPAKAWSLAMQYSLTLQTAQMKPIPKNLYPTH